MSNRQRNPKIINIVLIFVLIGFLTYFIVWIWGITDAYKTAEKINAGFRYDQMRFVFSGSGE